MKAIRETLLPTAVQPATWSDFSGHDSRIWRILWSACHIESSRHLLPWRHLLETTPLMHAKWIAVSLFIFQFYRRGASSDWLVDPCTPEWEEAAKQIHTYCRRWSWSPGRLFLCCRNAHVTASLSPSQSAGRKKQIFHTGDLTLPCFYHPHGWPQLGGEYILKCTLLGAHSLRYSQRNEQISSASTWAVRESQWINTE